MKRLSILGLVLFAASAVTSAFMPSKSTAPDVRYNGTCKGNAATVSCVADNDGTASCVSSGVAGSNAGAAENATTGAANCTRA